MTELQYGLIGLGAAAVAGVFAYNKWQERAHRKVAEQVLKSDHDDVLLGGEANRREEPRFAPEPEVRAERREPVLAGASEPEPEFEPETEVPVLAAEPEPEEAFEAEEEAPVPDVPAKLLDPRLDFIVTMELVDAVPATQILHSQRDALKRLSKPVVWVGFNDRSRTWETIAPDTPMPYRRLRIGLQMANRRGPLSEAELTVFIAAMQELADELLAVADMPSSHAVLDQAMDLDRFSADVDLEIGVNLVSRGTPFSGTKLRALAEAAGMVLGVDGLFTRYDDDGRVQFRLQNLESTLFSPDSIKTLSTHGLTFLLDVPRVDHADRVFTQMVELAKRFGETLQGTLVDDNRHPLNDAQLDHIKREFVVKPQATMAQFGIPAGGPLALRLFS
ncbi:MAG TPA: cell division protein ZipA C-terminal FtsZ-binding domain-containing protein [Rhodocyclaceae bacterium]|nr:cell division protein ZipA C-terminal FtsZ-binding domain-containing protein [Rhodocyclaceae bacterium]